MTCNLQTLKSFLRTAGAGLERGLGCRGCAPPSPEMTGAGLSNASGILQKSGSLVLVTPFLSGATPPKKILDPPLDRHLLNGPYELYGS